MPLVDLLEDGFSPVVGSGSDCATHVATSLSRLTSDGIIGPLMT